MNKYALIIVAAIAIGMPHGAAAQSKKGANGGIVATSQGHPIEFVRKGNDVIFYFSDHDGSPAPTKNMSGKATIQDGGKTTVVTLAPSSPNMLVGKSELELTPQAKVVLTATLKGGSHEHSMTARFAAQ